MGPGDILLSIALGVAANGVTALLGWLIKTWAVGDTGVTPSQTEQGRSLTDMIDYYVQQRRLAESQRRPVYRIEQRVTVEHRKSTDANDEAVGVLIVAFAVIVLLATVWQTYKLALLWGTVLGSILGWASSFYFVGVLEKVHGPHRIEDEVLSWGSMLVWSLGILGLYLGVYRPLYPDVVAQEELMLMLVQAAQLLGAVFVYIAIAVTAVLQFVAGSVYRKALHNNLPNRFEVKIWELRQVGIVVAAITLFFGFLLVSGILFQVISTLA